MATRKRNIKLDFWVTENERDLIDQRAKEVGFTDRSAYLRKRAIDVHLINVNMDGLKELKNEINKIGININQLVYKYHHDGNLDKIDIELLQKYMKDIIDIGNKEDDKLKNIYALDDRNEV